MYLSLACLLWLGLAKVEAVDSLLTVSKLNRPCQVTFRAHNTIPGPKLFLEDIADLNCPDVPALGRLDLGDAASFGLTRLVDVERIQNGPLASWSGRLIVVAPGRTVQVTTTCDTLSEVAMNTLVDSLYRDESLPPKARRMAQLFKGPDVILTPPGQVSVSLAFTGNKRRGKVPVELRIGTAGKVQRRLPLTLDVKIWAPVTVVKNTVRRGETFETMALEEQIRDVTAYPPGTLPILADCVGRIASATVMPGRIITLRLVEIPALVKRGDRIPLVIQEGQVKIAVDAIAKRDAHAGEVVPAWNPVSRKMIHGEVQGDGTLKMIADGG
jgi:flagellar basal body P-ring formation protein FlgA